MAENQELLHQLFSAWQNREVQKLILKDLDEETLTAALFVANDVAAAVTAEVDIRRQRATLTPSATIEPI